jgi:hypothetical protein
VDSAERPVLRRKLRRNEVLAFFAKLPPTVIGMGPGVRRDDSLRDSDVIPVLARTQPVVLTRLSLPLH